MKRAILPLFLCLGGCTTADRNVLAVGLCERTAGCTVTRNEPDYGPPQVRAMENRKPVSKTTEK
ncbi:hypothetical protein FPZ24_13630 [Sphingomonas panacisoli]|uniref:Uncharacterized protein n=1 Tax=Sphingomonas panacisoli TaxID=1813879 RepID=A0A5B8LJT6_9SPHN|nr:hypothetical protein [Sphingomonas panacisoli]QDZ08381.1 hypothetical protein FPZ24_13630 [Sphingomonas panacisoli]